MNGQNREIRVESRDQHLDPARRAEAQHVLDVMRLRNRGYDVTFVAIECVERERVGIEAYEV